MTFRLIGLCLPLLIVACAQAPAANLPDPVEASAKTCDLQYRVGSNIPTRDCRKQAETERAPGSAISTGKPGG